MLRGVTLSPVIAAARRPDGETDADGNRVRRARLALARQQRRGAARGASRC